MKSKLLRTDLIDTSWEFSRGNRKSVMTKAEIVSDEGPCGTASQGPAFRGSFSRERVVGTEGN